MAGTERGERTMFGSVPFAGTITERPTGMTSGGGCPCRPSRGCRTRVKLPGGSLPMIVRVSTPSRCSASACSSTCSTTAPQNDHEYGTTMPTFIAAQHTECCSLAAAPPRHEEVRPGRGDCWALRGSCETVAPAQADHDAAQRQDQRN